MNESRYARSWSSIVIGIVCAAARHGLRLSGLRLLLFLGLLVAGIPGALSISASAGVPVPDPAVQEEALPKDAKTETKQVTGQLVMVRKNKISVEYATEKDGSYEMLLPITPDVRFKYIRGLEQLQSGDTVTVEFEQTYREPEDGERVILKTVAKEIQLVKHAVPSSGSSQGE